MNLDNELKVAKKLAIMAGAEILKVYNDYFEVKYKDDESPLTIADERADKIIVEVLKRTFPDYAVLSEESEDDASRLNNDWCWIIDPLDGTKEFVKRNGEFTVNIALAYKQKVVLGVIYIPVTDELYFATKGDGAFYVPKCKDTKLEPQSIKVSNKINDITLLLSRSHAREELEELIDRNSHKIKDFKRSGSSIKGCLVAKGEAEVYYRYGITGQWDTAAMQCIVEEAGGILRQMDDSLLIYNRENCMNEKGFYILNDIRNKLE